MIRIVLMYSQAADPVFVQHAFPTIVSILLTVTKPEILQVRNFDFFINSLEWARIHKIFIGKRRE